MDKRVLIVEDEPEMGRLLRDIVEADFGARVVVAPNGRRALDVLLSFRPDVILLDLALPELDGLEVLHRLKGGAVTRHIPVIVVTAAPRGHRETTRWAWRAGCDGFIHKLYNFHHLEPMLAHYLADPRAT